VEIPKLFAQGFAISTLSGCAIAAGTCRCNNNTEAASEVSATNLPAGCHVTDSQTSAVQSIAGDGGRDGFIAVNARTDER